MGPQMGPKMGPKQKKGPQMGPKMGPWAWDMPNLDMGRAQPGMGHAQPGTGHAQPGHGTCPMPLDQGHAQPMGPNGPGSKQWARTAQGPNKGPERPRVQKMGPNGPGSNNWARTAQGPTIGPEQPRDIAADGGTLEGPSLGGHRCCAFRLWLLVSLVLNSK